MNSDCIFCKICAGELPASKVYEDEHVLAFMDIGPVSKGHTLVIPKEHCNPIAEAPDGALEKAIVVVKKIAGAQLRGLGADGINVTQANGTIAGQVIPHVHFHVIPRCEADGQGKNWIPGRYEDADEMESYAERIRAALGDS